MAWLTGWSYRKSHTINSAAGAGVNYQKKITVHYGSGSDSGEDVYLDSKCRTDFGDVRFTDNDETTELDYWMEEKVDSDYAIFWVEVADDLGSNQTIYIYYGNAGASTTSDGDATFLFFDNFNAALDGSKWTTVQGAISTNAGNLELVGTTGTRGLIEGQTAIPINSAIHTRAYSSNTSSNATHFLTMRTTTDWNNRAIDIYGTSTANAVAMQTWNGGSYTHSFPVSINTFTSWHVYSGTWKSAESTFYQDNVQKNQHTTDIPSGNEVVTFYEGLVNGDVVYVDWVFVRKWVDPEPSHGAWGSEETEGTPIPVMMHHYNRINKKIRG